jgi:uncharacterized protein YndB with AHSA1/START domain
MADSTTGNNLRITRLLDAPRALVFRAFMEPDQAAQWWSPEGFTTPLDSVTIEPRAGGRYDLDMVGPDGVAMPVRQEIVELVEDELLVLTMPAMPEIGLPEATVTRLELSDEDGGTRLVVVAGPYPEGIDAEEGWGQSLDKLERTVAELAA